MPQIRIKDAAAYLSVSDDTVRRWIDSGQLPSETDASNRKVVDGYVLAKFAQSHANPMTDPSRVERRPGTGSWVWSPRSSPTR